MRLLRLKVRNIASLKGEHLIDFEDISRHSSLFAITGETGAGKSSILNSIGLALFGRIFKTSLNQNDVVTLGEKEGQIDLIFEAKGKSYMASWRARVLKANGEPYSTAQSPVRELYSMEGREFSSAKTISSSKVDEILNLDFEQFCKCVILNQGEFAKFLTSTFNERKDILEKLYPGEVLESLSRELKAQSDAFIFEKNSLEIELQTLQGEGTSGGDLKANFALLTQKLELTESWFNLAEKINYHFISLCSYHSRFQDYQKRKEETLKEYAEETTKFNFLLKESEELTEKQGRAKSTLESRLPRLQELLKAEEALKHHQKERMELTQDISSSEEKLAILKSKEVATLKRQELGQAKRQDIQAKIMHPLNLLKQHKGKFNDLFDTFTRKELLGQDLGAREQDLSALEEKGRDTASVLETIEQKLQSLSPNIQEEFTSILLKKKEANELCERRQRAEIKIQELNTILKKTKDELIFMQERLKLLTRQIEAEEQEIAPLKTTLKLQEVLSAVKVCLQHEESRVKETCPVCTSRVSSAQWVELESSVLKNDFLAMEERVKLLERSILKAQEQTKVIQEEITKSEHLMREKTQEIQELSQTLSLVPEDLQALEERITFLQKQSWDQEKLAAERTKIHEELGKTRLSYKKLKEEINLKREKFRGLSDEVTGAEIQLKDLLPSGLSQDSLKLIKEDLKLLDSYEEQEALSHKIAQELEFMLLQQRELHEQNQLKQKKLEQILSSLKDLQELLHRELGQASASSLIQKLQDEVKLAQEECQKQEQALKKQELKLKEHQSKLYSYDEQLKDSEMLFAKELMEVRENSRHTLPSLKEELSQLVKIFSELSLALESPSSLYFPLKERLEAEREFLKKMLNEARAQVAANKARLEDWEKKQDRIKLLLLKKDDLLSKLSRLERLSQVLGKDELRSFVLSLVEENLIRVTNQELQRLCQGRYEIIHQTKGMRLTPEFYILDKFREGGRRKVSTLSGGETFMVSLAMALGLAEMTRGQADIDSLFIDEGFGTLDQESLEDVLEMLGQIQTRGLMVGIISHIKALTNALPVNLVLNKKNDGTSTVGMRFN